MHANISYDQNCLSVKKSGSQSFARFTKILHIFTILKILIILRVFIVLERPPTAQKIPNKKFPHIHSTTPPSPNKTKTSIPPLPQTKKKPADSTCSQVASLHQVDNCFHHGRVGVQNSGVLAPGGKENRPTSTPFF